MKERRKFKRHEVSIPCTIYWHDHKIRGEIANLSLGGALITQLKTVPPKHAFIVLTFEAEEGPVLLRGQLTSRVIHTLQQPSGPDGAGSIGLQFQEDTTEVRLRLAGLLGDHG